ncbi:MAG: hypothetical protein NTV01_15500 [Bacteroidia bacterium]|nr:hypothetical protein [Bacteroidia bacterium]
MKHRYTLIFLILIGGIAAGQDLRQFEYLYGTAQRPSLNSPDSLNHSSVRNLYPFLPDSVKASTWLGSRAPLRNWLISKVLHESTLIIKKPGYFITADPVFDAEPGRETVSGKNTWVNTRGVQVYGRIDLSRSTSPPAQPGFEFYTAYFESQAKLPPYLDSIAGEVGGVPGQGYFRRADGSIDHGYATGWLRYKASRYFTFEAGTGRNFFGNGYRSMLLSDNARNAPYFRIDTRLWRLHYVNLWSEFQDNKFVDAPGGAYQKKYGAFHYLSYSITKRLEISFFEAVIWQGRDNTHTRGFDVNYLNPIILYRPVEWTTGSPDNALMGAGINYRFFNNTFLYGQFIIDEWSVTHMKARDGWYGNKYGGQIGAKTSIPLEQLSSRRRPGSPNPAPNPSLSSRRRPGPPDAVPGSAGIYLQSELNLARPYTFSHYNIKQSYSHFSQPLAHPLGANFIEWVNFASLRWNRFMLEGRYSRARFGANYNGLNYGQNVLLPYTSYVNELGNFIGQGLETHLTYKTISFSYLLNPASLLNLFVSLSDRHQKTDIQDKHELWLTFGIRNSIRNFYYDF